jgi:[ribosomal protein S5]-alanine N-acetyltransferase
VELVLARCTVRSFRASDSVSIARCANDPRIAAQLRDRFPHPYALADAEAYIERVRREDPPTSMAIEVAGAAVGGIGLERQPDIHACSVEIGYWLGVDYWGCGIATQAIAAVTLWAMDTFGLARVFALPFADNAASCRALEKAGYVLEGTLRRSAIKQGVVRDQRVYAQVR